MNQFNATNVSSGAQTDLGLRTFLLGTYRYMAMAMAVTATVAFFTGQAMTPALEGLIFNPIVAIGMIMGIMFGFGIVGKKLPSMSKGGVLAFLFGFAAVMGVFMSAYATAAYSPTIVAKIFMQAFGAASLLLAFINMFQILMSLFGRE